MNDDDFQKYVSSTLANLPSVEAVMLGGSRARGRNIDASDWDFAIYTGTDFGPTISVGLVGAVWCRRSEAGAAES